MSQAPSRSSAVARLLRRMDSMRGSERWLKPAPVRRLVTAAVVAGVALLVLFARHFAYDSDRRDVISQARLLTTSLLVEEAHLKEDVLRARYGLAYSEDAVTVHVQSIEVAASKLQALRQSAQFAALTARYRADAAAEAAQVAAFQTLNEKIRDVLDAFVAQMRVVLPQLPDAGPNGQLQHQLGKVAIDVMQQAVKVDSKPTPHAVHNAELAFSHAASALPRDRKSLELMARRVALIEQGLPALAESVHAIIDSGTRADLLRIQAQLARDARARQSSDEQQHVIGLVLLVLLLSGLITVSWRYVKSLNFAKHERNFLQGLAEGVGLGIFVVAADDCIIFANSEAERLLCFPSMGLIGRRLHDGVHVREDGSLLVASQCGFCTDPQKRRSHEEVDTFFRRHDGVVIPVAVHVSPYQGADGDDLIVVFGDIRERQEVEHRLRRLSQAIEQSPASIIMTDSGGRIEYVNQAFINASGYSRAEVLGQNPRILQSGKTSGKTYQAMWATLLAGGTWRGELVNRRKDGVEYIEAAVIAPVRHDDGHVTHYIAVKDDITARKAAEREIQQLAFFDALTGLPNRRYVVDRIRQAGSASQRSGSFCAVMILDVDHFKEINDTLGHDMGDFLLTSVAERLKASVRAEDVVARLGGDEFIILIENIGAIEEEAASHAERIGAQVLAALRRPFALDGRIGAHHVDALNRLHLPDEFVSSHRATASLGVALFRGDAISVETLFKQADLAMYKAKEEGRDALRFFNSDMQRAINMRVALDDAMRRGLDRGEFRLHYQPQVDLHGRVTGAEALVRWVDEQGFERSPAAFIPAAESSGLILPLGDWVLDAACAQLKDWEAAPGTRALSIAVNISAHQFRADDFVAKVRAVVASRAVDPRRLKLELTESVFVGDIDGGALRMKELSAIGIRLSLDDFGTGYSSLAYLKRMPLDQIKIDQSFVRDIEQDSSDAAIVRAIIAMCVSLDIDVIAEGVETENQRAFLVRNGCRAFQGYLFGRPTPAAQWDEFLGEGDVARIV